jgi:hypothetical protein
MCTRALHTEFAMTYCKALLHGGVFHGRYGTPLRPQCTRENPSDFCQKSDGPTLYHGIFPCVNGPLDDLNVSLPTLWSGAEKLVQISMPRPSLSSPLCTRSSRCARGTRRCSAASPGPGSARSRQCGRSGKKNKGFG